MPQRIVLPGERLPTLNLGRLSARRHFALLAASPTSRRRAWSGMAETACYPSNAFCGPIQGEMKTQSIMKRTSSPARQDWINAVEAGLTWGLYNACFHGRRPLASSVVGA
jgi:hypothetical protein